MDRNARRIINGLQSGFPLVRRPFAEAAAGLEMDEARLIDGVDALLKEGFLSRFGPLFNAERMGGGLTLAAMAVPEDDFERATAAVNAFPEVAHNYARDHALNMWFVVATETAAALPEVLARIEREAGYPVFNLPKLQEYHLGFKVHLDAQGIDTVPLAMDPGVPPFGSDPGEPPDATDRAIITATQAGLPLMPHPYDAVADQVGLTADAVMTRLAQMIKRGWVRRIGVVPNHYRLGLRGNGMSVWALPDDQVDTLGRQVGALGFVSHCYRRPTHLPEWPFNLFAMVHGRDRAAVAEKAARIERLLRPELRAHALLYSSRILKKTGLRLRHGGGDG